MNISVVIPALNEEEKLTACLEALARQTVRPYEVIVVDNDSSDATAAIARKFAFVTVLTEPKIGRAHARNTGFTAAGGDIIARIDADAVVPNDWLEHIAAFYTGSSQKAVAWTGGALFYNLRFPHFMSGVYNWLVFRFNRLLIGHPTLWGSNMALPSSVWHMVAADVCLDNDIHEDLDVSIHLHRLGVPIVYDRNSHVRVQMRRIRSNRRELWAYLQMWPNTLRRHGMKVWVFCWVVGVGLLYLLSPVPVIIDWLARLFGRKPLAD